MLAFLGVVLHSCSVGGVIAGLFFLGDFTLFNFGRRRLNEMKALYERYGE